MGKTFRRGMRSEKQGICTNCENLKTWISLLRQLGKVNIDFPEYSFSGLNSATIGFICRHGNIHCGFFNNYQKAEFDKTLDQLDLIEIPFCTC